jgi:hypothetical protein
MMGIAHKLADVHRRIAETEERIAEARARLDRREGIDPALSTVMLESTETTLGQLRSYGAA